MADRQYSGSVESQSTFCIDLLRVTNWDAFNNLMSDLQDAQVAHARREAEHLEIPLEVAMNVIYLRGRSRWTLAKENKLIALSKQGLRPNIMEWDGEDVLA
jgi:hypothetical protein